MRKRNSQVSIIQFSSFLHENKAKLLVLFGVYQLVCITISLQNYPYIDDVLRQETGITDFAASYARWGSELGSWFLQGSRHLTDLGLTTSILTGIFMAVSSLLLIFILFGTSFSWGAVIGSLTLGINPWALQLISFRFDSPYMALSIVASIIPFLFWNQSNWLFGGISLLSILVMTNTYQAASGIFIVVALTIIYRKILMNTIGKKDWQHLLTAGIAYILGMLLFLVESTYTIDLTQRGATVAIAPTNELFSQLAKNAQGYVLTIKEQSATIWLLCYTVLLVGFFLMVWQVDYKKRIRNLSVSCMYLFLMIPLSYGVLLVFQENLIETTPRYGVGISIVFATVAMLSSEYSANHIGLLNKILVGLLSYYFISFSLSYASLLTVQLEAFKQQSTQLTNDLSQTVTPTRKNVLIGNLFKDSPVVINAERNYPIVKKLVPRNNDLYWPNLLLFKRYSSLPIELIPHDFSTFDSTGKQLVVDNAFWTIYIDVDTSYVIHK